MRNALDKSVNNKKAHSNRSVLDRDRQSESSMQHKEDGTVVLPSSVLNTRLAPVDRQNYLSEKSCSDKNDVQDVLLFHTEEKFGGENRKIVDMRPGNKDDGIAMATKPRLKASANTIADILRYNYSFGVKEGQLYIYEERYGYWKMIQASNENRELRALISEEDKSSVNKNALCEIYEWLCIGADDLSESSDEGKYFLNFKDCAVNWKTENCVNDRKRLYFTYYLNLNYRELRDYENGTFKDFLKDVFGEDKKTKKEFAKFLGLCLSDIRNLKICTFLYGPSNTGKSVVLNLLKLLVGKEWTASVSFSQLGNEFAISRLLGKRLNVSGEVSGTTNKRLDIFKSLTGNDEIEICFKGKDYFSFKSNCLLVFACNNFPPIYDIPEFQSFLSRIIIFPFENEKPRSEWVDNMENVLFGDAKEIISFAIKGLRYLEEDSFQIKETKAMKECKHEFLGLYDSFSLFAEKFLEANVDSKVSSKDIENAYHKFCIAEGYNELDVNIWGQILKRKYHCEHTTVTVDYGTDYMGNPQKRRVRGYQGIRIKRDEEIDQDNSEWIVKRRAK